MELAKIESLALALPFDSVDIVTSVGTPKRYATGLSGEQFSVFNTDQKNQQSMELFCDVTKSEHAHCNQLENT
jgi:hypothetical protein